MTFSESELLSSDSTLSVPPLPKLIPGGWIEPPFSTQNLSPKETSFDIAIKPRSLFKFSPDCHSVALSPDCKSATFFTESLVRIFSLRDPKPNLILEKTPTRPKSSYKAAVASNRFLAVVTDEHLKVYIYGPSNPDGIEIGTETFSSDSSECPWGPNCVAIHETEERTWIAVGGCGNKKGQEYGSIRMYRVDATAGSFTLTAQSANFARQDDFTPEGPLSNDYLKMIAFSPDGRRLVAVTAYNRALVWFLSNNRRPRHAPFEILKKYTMVCSSRIPLPCITRLFLITLDGFRKRRRMACCLPPSSIRHQAGPTSFVPHLPRTSDGSTVGSGLSYLLSPTLLPTCLQYYSLISVR
jgi:hypothetical protein